MLTEATVRLVDAPARPGAGGPRLPRRERGGRRGAPTCCRCGPLTVEGMAADLVPGTRRETLPRGAAWLFVEIGGGTPAEARPGPRRSAGTPRGDRRDRQRGGHRPGRAARAVADPRGRAPAPPPGCPTAARRGPAGRTARCRPPGSAPTCGSSGALLAEHGLRGAAVRALRRRLHPRPHRLRPADRRRAWPASGGSPRSWRTWSSRTAARCPASTATGRPAPSCCPGCTAPEMVGALRRVQGPVGPGRRAQPGSAGPPGAVGRRPALRGAAPRARSTWSSATRTTAATSRRRSAAASGSPSAVTTAAGSGRRDVPVLPGDRRGAALHPRAGPGCCTRCWPARWSPTAGAPRRSATRSTCACPARAAARDCPVGVDMATYKAEFLHHHYAGRLRPRVALLDGPAAVLAAAGGGAAAARRGQRAGPGRPAGRGRQAAGRDRAGARRCRGWRPETFLRWWDAADTAPEPGDRRPTVVLWPDTFTDHLRPAAGRAAVRVLEAAGLRRRRARRGRCAAG